MKFTTIFFLSLFGFAALASAQQAQAGECRADGDSIKSALAAKHRIPTAQITIVEISNTVPAKTGYVETTVGYETPDTMAHKTSRVTVKGWCK